MIYKDFIDGSGVYSAIFAIEGVKDKLPLINEVVTAKSLDAKFLYQNGNKEVNDNLIDLQNAVQIILARYYDKWVNYANELLLKNNPVGTTTTIKTTGSSKAQTSAMDSNNLIDTDGTTQDATTTENKVTQQDRSQYLNMYQKYSIYDMIDTDIRRLLFINVY